MDLEVSTLISKMTVKNTVNVAGMDFNEGTLEGIDAVIVKCGIGKVNAGMCVQILADLFKVTHVINTGVAGSLKDVIDIGDIVVSTDALEHDMDVTALGYKPGEIPQMGRLSFEADSDLIKKAENSCKKVNPDINVYTGRVVSGDQFISSKEVKNRLIELYDGYCAEMEGGAIAHAAYLNKLPFVVIRAISDKADDSAEMDYPTFEKKAAEHCAALILDLVPTI